MIDFKKAKFTTTYSFSSSRGIVRTLSDAFSKEHCDTKLAALYGAQFTEGKCLFCGRKNYVVVNGVPTFSNTIHYDHIYPASRFGLFEVGNVAIACETCNLAKSDRLPLEYYDIRAAENLSLLYYDREEFIDFLDRFTKPYQEKWPEYYKANHEEFDDETFKEAVTNLFYNKVNISASSMRYNHENSVNWGIWEKTIKKAYDTYKDSTAKDVEHRIGFANERFEILFGSSRTMEDTTLAELKEFADDLLIIKYDSKNEVQKYRMLIKMLLEVLNENLMNADFGDLWNQVPTYSKIRREDI